MMMVSSMVSFAQYTPGTVSIRPEVGVAASNVLFLENSGGAGSIKFSNPRLGMIGGAEIDYQAAKWFGISAGALYAQMGGKNVQNTNMNLKYNNIAVPVLLNFYPCKGLCLKTGIQPTFNIKSLASGSDIDSEYFVGDNINKFDLQVPVGISYEYKGFIVDARYQIGLKNILKDCKNEIADLRMHNMMFSLTLGYKFSLGK